MKAAEKIETYLKVLSLQQIAEIYQVEAEKAAKAKRSYHPVRMVRSSKLILKS